MALDIKIIILKLLIYLVHIHLKTLAHLAAVAAHDARMHHLHQLFASHVSSDFPDSSYVSVQDAKLQTVLALMGAINAEFALPVSQLAGLYGSKVSNHSIPMGPTPGVR